MPCLRVMNRAQWRIFSGGPMIKKILFLPVIALVASCNAMEFKRMAVVCKPIASVWTQPQEDKLNPGQKLPLMGCLHIPHYDNQLLYGQPVIIDKEVVIIEEKEGEKKECVWYQVRSLDDPEWKKDPNNPKAGKWDYCSGWVRKDPLKEVEKLTKQDLVVSAMWTLIKTSEKETLRLPMGSVLKLIEKKGSVCKVALCDGSEGFVAAADVYKIETEFSDKVETVRSYICAKARAFLGAPYCWGGRSPYDETETYRICSPDCSGLNSLIFRSRGLIIPRNSHDQFLASISVNPKDILPGDFVFLQPPYNPETKKGGRVNHVMIYMGSWDGNEWIIETTGHDNLAFEDRKVRLVAISDKFGMASLKTCKNGQLMERFEGGKKVSQQFELYVGTFCNAHKLQQLRDAWF